MKAYRRCWNHAAFRDKLDAAIWNYLYQNAAWEDTVVNHHGERIQLTRGQILISCRELADDFCTSEKRVRSLLQALADGRTGGAMIGTQRTHRGTIITICNYDKYQGTKNADGAQEAHSGRTEGHFPNKDNKTKETKETNTTLLSGTDFQKVFEFGYGLFPNLMTANTSEIHKWLQAGCSIEHDILPAIKRSEGKNVKSWNYFSGAVMDAKATREKPLPKGIANEHTSKYSTSKPAASFVSEGERLAAKYAKEAERERQAEAVNFAQSDLRVAESLR